jgi:hypothetical protein
MPYRPIPKKLTLTCRFVLVLASVVGASATARAQTTPATQPADRPVSQSDLDAVRAAAEQKADAVERRLEAHEEVIARLHEQLWAERAAREAAERAFKQVVEESARAAGDTPLVRAGKFNLTISGFLQMDAVAWNQQSQDQLNPATGDPLNQTRFNLRRARLRAEVDWRVIGGAVEFDGNTNNGYQARIIGAEASLKWKNPASPQVPYLQLMAGSFKIPFGFEVGQRDTDRLFLERSNMEKAFFTGEYDLGARLFGGWKFLRYSLAVMNGDPIGEKAFPGRDPHQSKDLIGRLGVELKLLHRLGIGGDFSGLWGSGFHKGTPATKNTLFWRDTNQDGAVQLNEITVLPAQAATPSANFGRWAVGGDVRLALQLLPLGELFLYGEITYAANLDRFLVVADPVSANRDLRELGYYVGVTQELTQWAIIGVRYDHYDPDRDANDLRTGQQVPKDASYSTLAVAAAVRYPGYARLIFEYDHNTNALGRTLDGTPTTLAADAFTIRAEVKF